VKLKADLTGFSGLEAALVEIEQLSGRTATGKNAVRRGMRKAMKRIEDRAKQMAPADDGRLRESITTKNAKARRQRGSVKFQRQTGVELLTGPTGRPEGGYAAWQEFGTVKMAANPFMRPAADTEGQSVVDDVIDIIRAEVMKSAARARKKAASKG